MHQYKDFLYAITARPVYHTCSGPSRPPVYMYDTRPTVLFSTTNCWFVHASNPKSMAALLWHPERVQFLSNNFDEVYPRGSHASGCKTLMAYMNLLLTIYHVPLWQYLPWSNLSPYQKFGSQLSRHHQSAAELATLIKRLMLHLVQGAHQQLNKPACAPWSSDLDIKEPCSPQHPQFPTAPTAPHSIHCCTQYPLLTTAPFHLQNSLRQHPAHSRRFCIQSLKESAVAFPDGLHQAGAAHREDGWQLKKVFIK